MHNELTKKEILEIKRKADDKLVVCRKKQDIIGTQIFSILSLHARVIYYPLGKDAPWGFTHISGLIDDSSIDKPFVTINTSIPLDCQVFAAAHELYHIWYENKPNILPSDLLNEQDKAKNEMKANRFAAEFLVDEILLKQEINLHKIDEYTIKNILLLCDLFVVPYRTMVKRLREENYITEEKLRVFLSESDESINKYRKIYSLSEQKPDNRVSMDNLVELAVNAYTSELITFEKLEYLLSLSNLTPEDVGIAIETEHEFPSDDELENIMEE